MSKASFYFQSTFLCLLGILLTFSCFTACNQSSIVVGPSMQSTRDSLMIAQLFSKTKNSKDSSTNYIQQAEEIARKSNTVKCQAIYLALLGRELILTGQLDSSNNIADKGLQLNYSAADIGYKGKFYNLKGQVQALKRNPYESIDYYLKAEKIFAAAADSSSLAGIYSNTANSYFSLKDYKTAAQFATKAYSLKNSVKDAGTKANIITTYALSLIKIQDTKKALLIEEEADSLATTTHNVMAKVVATIGFAEIYKTARQFDSAIKYYDACIAMSRKIGVQHFELMSKVGLMSIYEETANSKAIIGMADSTLFLANTLHNTDVLHTMKRIIGRAFAKEKNFDKGFQFLNESYNLYDSSSGIENQKNINELLVKYDAEKKEKEIINQKLRLAEQETQLRNRQIVILGLILGLAILLIVPFYIRKLNRERLMRLEVERQKNIGDAYINGEQKERTRLAFEIHDGIASTLTGITYKLRADNANKVEVISLLTGLHEDTRRIAHSLMPIDFEQRNLAEALHTLCEKMTNPEVEVMFLANNDKVALNPQKSLLYYRIIQELINNALKHAQCKSIFVRLQSDEIYAVNISVEDDGIGFNEEEIALGFSSIKERVKSLGAQLVIKSGKQEGTTININNKR